jgi:hypothetical protein
MTGHWRDINTEEHTASRLCFQLHAVPLTVDKNLGTLLDAAFTDERIGY